MRFPHYRPRRLRQRAALRALVRETELSVSHLVQPLFVREGTRVRKSIGSMPGQFQYSVDELVKESTRAHKLGVPAVILFGIPDRKDDKASGAYASNGIVPKAVCALKKELPELIVICDVCLCEYMSHGHCGVVRQGKILNDATLSLLAKSALAYAEAGADVVAPSDMMDGRVGVIRSALDKAGFKETPILSYAAKFAGAFYGPFREAAESTPQFGDRRGYQLNAANSDEAMREVWTDIEEGADMVMVKPAGPFLDVIHRVKAETAYPLAAYQVSSEYAMIQAASDRGWVDGDRAIMESLLAIRRAGADVIITYFARRAATLLKQGWDA